MKLFQQVEWKMNVPNALSIVRLLLLPVFAVLFLISKDNLILLYASVGVLVLSGVTDVLDGFIARRFNQITPLGKLLDPLADKCTQVTVVICLALRYHGVFPLAVLCLLKEGAQAVGGAILLAKGVKPQSSRWYGKISTVVFYVAMAAIIQFKDMPPALFWTLIGVVAAFMAFAFLRYFLEYLRIRRDGSGSSKADEIPSKE